MPRPLRTQQAFDAVFALCRERLEPPLLATLAAFEQRLFELAERSRSDVEQQQYLDSSRIVQRESAELGRRFLLALAAGVEAGEVETADARNSSHAKLELLATQTLEENIAADDMAARGESRASMVLFELGHRFAVLNASPVLSTEALPLGPYSISRALQQAAANLDIPIAHRLELYRLFDDGVMAQLTEFYDTVNELLVQRGILPNLRAFLPRRREQDRARQAPRAFNAADDKAQSAASGDVDHTAAHSGYADAGFADPGYTGPGYADPGEDEQTFAALSELLAQRRRAVGAQRIDRGAHLASTEDLHQVLTELQQRPSEVRGAGGPSKPRSMQQLRQDMLAQLRKFHPDAAAPRLATEHLDVIELMTMLFDRLVEDVHSQAGSGLLSRLQAPLLRVALDDQNFFTQRAHPARRWLNTVAEASNRWGGDGDEGDPGLIDKMDAMVARANREFSGDTALFDGLSNELQGHMDTLQHKVEVTERRYVEASKGRDRLEIARRRAHELIDERLAGSDASSLTRAMLQRAWSDLLALILLREGEDSDAFRRKLAVADTLASGEFSDREQLCVDVEHGLAQVGVPSRDAQLLAREAVGAPALDDSEEPVTRTELALKLKQRVSAGDREDSPLLAVAAAPTLSVDEQRMLDRIKTLAFGTWFDVDDANTGTVVRRKMAWYSTQTGRCLFVNQRGARADDINLEQLARAMVAGNMRLPPPPKGSLIDRAWDAIVAKLKSVTATSATPTGESAA